MQAPIFVLLPAEMRAPNVAMVDGCYTHGLWHNLWFLPCDAMRCTVFGIVILSVRPSVSLSHSWIVGVHMVRPTIMISSPYGNPIILVSEISRSSQNSKGVTRARALNEGGVGTNWRFSTNKPPYFQNGSRYD